MCSSCLRLDRRGRNVRHLVTLFEELQALGIAFVSLGEGVDATTPADKLQLHILAALTEFERGRIRERVLSVKGAEIRFRVLATRVAGAIRGDA